MPEDLNADFHLAIELNLRLPSMVRGKKGFERVVWAFNHVLDRSLTWLFHDLKASTDGSGPIAEHHPIIKTIAVDIRDMGGVDVPRFPQQISDDDCEMAGELLEWISVACIRSPRIMVGDDVDSYVSRYQGPDFRKEGSEESRSSTQNLFHLHWHGLLPSKFVLQIYLATLKVSGDGWFALTASGFNGSTYTVLQDQNRTMTWEYAG